MASSEVERERFSYLSQSHRPLRNSRSHKRFSKMMPDGSGIVIPPVNQKRSNRSDSYKPFQGRRHKGAKKPTEPAALLPPIRTSTLRQQRASLTDDDVTSTPSPVEDALILNGADSNTVSAIGVVLPHSDKEQRALLQRKENHSNMSLSETTEAIRLSPAATSEKLRGKGDQRFVRSTNDVVAESPVTSEKTLLNSSLNPMMNRVTPPPKCVKKNPARRTSMQYLPKLLPSEEPFSIRRKIEQFRKWHEERYAEKLKKLKVETETEQERLPSTSVTPFFSVEIDFARILEENMKNIRKTCQTDSYSKGVRKASNWDESSLKRGHASHNPALRLDSACTWRTWRDVNDSYAYNDVMKYIEENELMPPERLNWIQSWLIDVERAIHEEEGDREDNSGNESVSGS